MSSSARKTKINAKQYAAELVALIDGAASVPMAVDYFLTQRNVSLKDMLDRVMPKVASLLILRHGFEEAYAVLTQGLLEDPCNPYLLTVRGKLQWKQGDVAGAQATYESLPTHIPARNSLARLLLELGQTHRARALYEETLAMTNDTNVVALNGLAKLLIAEGSDEARARAQLLLESSLELKWQDNDASDIAKAADLTLNAPAEAHSGPQLRLV